MVVKGHTLGDIQSQVLPVITTPYAKSRSKMLALPGGRGNVGSSHTSEELIPDLISKKLLLLFIEGRGALSYGVHAEARGRPARLASGLAASAEPLTPRDNFLTIPLIRPHVLDNFTVLEQSEGDQ